MYISVLASHVSDKFGVPALIAFLAIGMLAGSDGPGGIRFDNAEAANLLGTMALAFILFSGGLDTNWRVVRTVLLRGLVLSTVGVAITAGLLGVFAWLVLGLDPVVAFLLGAIVSSTDAAAVFSVLRRRGVSLKGQLKPLLEFESGSNDPMAVFLTVSMTQLLTEPTFTWTSLIPAFLVNMVGGVVVGLAAGKFAKTVFNRIRLDYEGLYPVLSTSTVLLTFGLAEYLGCNGFLAVYVCGIMLNASDFAYQRYVVKFHDGTAWLMQIILFVVLGLLVFPTQLPSIAPTALAAALFLMFVARPVAVTIGLWGSQFSVAERVLTAWTGLRGAVPIVLATFPLMAGYEGSDTLFHMVFFIVVTSVLCQGTLLMPLARRLKVDEPLPRRPRFSFDLQRGGEAQGDTREIEVLPNTAAVGRTIADLDIPPSVLVLLIGRGNGFVIPRGQTRIEAYDTLLLLGDPPGLREAGDAVLSPEPRRRHRQVSEDPLAVLPQSTDRKYLSKQIVVVGYGRIGRRVCDDLAAKGVPFVVVDQNREIVEGLRGRGIPAVLGDGCTAMALAQAHIVRAAMLIIATPDTLKVRQMAEIATMLNPGVQIVIRADSEMEANLLKREKVGAVFLAEDELARSIAEYALQHTAR